MTIVGTTIGAGFASGREIWEFFGSYGEESHWGIILSMVLFFLSCMKHVNHQLEVSNTSLLQLFEQLYWGSD